MSFSFLSDAFPEYKASGASVATALYEDFGSFSSPVAKKQQEDSDLLVENFSDYNLPIKDTRGVPKAFDASDDYFRLINAVNGGSDNPMVGVQQVREQAPSAGIPSAGIPSAGDSKEIGCMDVAAHLDHCEECKQRLEVIFRRLVSTQEPPQKKQENNSVTTDLILLIVLGIFIVFVLDIFVRLGKYLKR